MVGANQLTSSAICSVLCSCVHSNIGCVVRDTILVKTEGAVTRGSHLARPVDAVELADNINAFLGQVDNIMDKTPDTVGKFKFKKFTVTAEISAEGKLVLLGTGVTTSVTGGITFEFERE